MSNWRGKIWVKVIALSVAGVFLFSEASWAAQVDSRLHLNITEESYPSESGPSLKGTLAEAYQIISSFFLASAHAEDANPYPEKEGKVLPVLKPNSKWKKPAEALRVEEADSETAAEEPAEDDEQAKKKDIRDEEGSENTANLKLSDAPDVSQKDKKEVHETSASAGSYVGPSPEENNQHTDETGEPENQDTPPIENKPPAEHNGADPTTKLENPKATPENTNTKEESAASGSTQEEPLYRQANEPPNLPREPEEPKEEVNVNAQPAIDLKPDRIEESAQQEIEAKVRPDSEPEPVEIQKPAQESVAVPKKETGAQNPDNENIQKEEALISSHTTVQETKEQVQSNASGRRFIIPPLEKVTIPPVPQQAKEENHNQVNPQDKNQTASLTDEDKAEGVNPGYRVEDTGKRIDELYKAAPPTGPPAENKDKPTRNAAISPQSSGNSAANEPVESTGLFVAHQQSGITPREETALPKTESHSVLHNHGPPR